MSSLKILNGNDSGSLKVRPSGACHNSLSLLELLVWNTMSTHPKRRQNPQQNQRVGVESSTLVDDECARPQEKLPLSARFHGGWRTGVAWSALGGLLVLVINLSFLIWIKSWHPIQEDGTATVFQGSCATKKTISRWSHLLINICSTL